MILEKKNINSILKGVKKKIYQQENLPLFHEENQQQFLERILQFEKTSERGMINFCNIKSYVEGYSGILNFEFVHQLTRIILNYFKQDKTALYTLHHLSQKTQFIQKITDFDLQRHLIELIEQNKDKEDNYQIEFLVCQIIYRLFQKWSNKLFFNFLPDYYEIIIHKLRFPQRQVVLKLMVSASNYAALLPNTKTILAILQQSTLQNERINQTSLSLVCQIFKKFLKEQKNLQIYDQFIHWISIHIECCHYNDALRGKIAKLLQIIIQKDMLSDKYIHALWQNPKFIDAIVDIVRYEMDKGKGQTFILLFLLMCRIPLRCLHQIMQVHSLVYIVSHYLSNLLQKDAFMMLCLLDNIIKCNSQYIVVFKQKREIQLIQNCIDPQQVEIQEIAMKLIDLLEDDDIKEKNI